MVRRAVVVLFGLAVACSEDPEKSDGTSTTDDTTDGGDDGTTDTDDTDDPEDTADTGDTGDTSTMDADGDGYDADVDCDDTNPDVNPGATELAGDGIDNDCNESTCAGAGFSGATVSLDLPTGYGARTFGTTGNGGDCEGERPRWTYTDLTGDGREDIVMLRSPCGDAEPGITTWTVHERTDTGFAEGVSWPIPSGLPEGMLVRPGNPAGCDGNGLPRWALRDITGDQRPDIIVTQDCDDASEVGTIRWRIFANTGSGFASETAYSLPPGYATGILDDFGGQADCSTAHPGYSLIDLDGDGDEDFVITSSACGDTDPGLTTWSVHDNDGTGFSGTATSFSLPSYPAGTFASPGHGGSCSDGIPRWNAVDLDGDSFLDAAVVWADCEDEVVGTSEWLVYPGSSTGFSSTATTWTLPEGYGRNAFSAIAGDLNCPEERPRYELLDLDGDARPELVVTRSPCEDDDVGTVRWLAYHSSGAAFSSTGDDWLLPTGYGNGTFYQLSASRECSPEVPGWVPGDANQDGFLDAIVTSSACLDDEVGATVWAVHEGGCSL